MPNYDALARQEAERMNPRPIAPWEMQAMGMPLPPGAIIPPPQSFIPPIQPLPKGHKKKKKKNIVRRAVELPFKAVREIAKPIVKNLPKPIRNALPAIGAIGGSLIGGPWVGGMLGGALGGAARGGKHPMDRALGGSALGGLSSLALGGLGGGGLGGLGGAAPGAAGAGGAGAGLGGGLFGSTGLMNSLIGGGGGLGTLLNTGLLATSIGGAIKAKRKKNPRESETLQDAIDRSKGRRTSSADWNRPLRERGQIKQHPEGYRGTNWNYFPTPEEQEEQLRRVNEEIAQEIPPQRRQNEEVPEGYARGGYVKDYYDGQEGGQSDRRLVKVRPKSYIVNSTTVSLAGDGNSKNGAKLIKNWAKSFQNGHFFNEDNRNVLKAYVSDGELKLQPEEVMAIGEGDINNGVRVIKKMERRMRKHKGVNKFLPPKSKPLDVYAGIVR